MRSESVATVFARLLQHRATAVAAVGHAVLSGELVHLEHAVDQVVLPSLASVVRALSTHEGDHLAIALQALRLVGVE